MTTDSPPQDMADLLQSPDLAVALESDRFKDFLDNVPLPIAVSALNPRERIVYANRAFGELTGSPDIVGQPWDVLGGTSPLGEASRSLGAGLVEDRDYVGRFMLRRGEDEIVVDAWSNLIEDDAGAPVFRLVALAKGEREVSLIDALAEQVREKDVQLMELQHRVKNNLQMITALIRVEARGVTDRTLGEGFDRLAGRVEALGLLYHALGHNVADSAIDLGVYLGEIASSVMRAHAVEGIRLELKTDSWPVSVDVAMPTGLVVNELMTNALKHAFAGRERGTISLEATNVSSGCRVVVADDGVGLPPGVTWPRQGKLSALIVRSLQQNAQAHIEIQSAPGQGCQVTIVFSSEDAAPQ